MITSNTRWSAWEIRPPGGTVEDLDLVLQKVVAPTLIDRSITKPWFFLRYWNGAAHLRFRIADLSTREIARVQADLNSSLSGIAPLAKSIQSKEEYLKLARILSKLGEGGVLVPIAPFRPTGVYTVQYLPETKRYGAAKAMPYAEKAFCLSSQIALALVIQSAPMAIRQAFIARLAQALNELFVRNYSESIPEAMNNDSGFKLTRFPDSAWPESDQDRVRRLLDLPTESWAARKALRSWLEAVEENLVQAVAPSGVLSAAVSQLHMFANRLGVSMGFESLIWQTIGKKRF